MNAKTLRRKAIYNEQYFLYAFLSLRYSPGPKLQFELTH